MQWREESVKTGSRRRRYWLYAEGQIWETKRSRWWCEDNLKKRILIASLSPGLVRAMLPRHLQTRLLRRTPSSLSRPISAPSARRAFLSIKSALAPAAAESLTSRDAASSDPITLNGWIRSCRRQKNIAFAVLNDGSTVKGIQVVLPKGMDAGCGRLLLLLPHERVGIDGADRSRWNAVLRSGARSACEGRWLIVQGKDRTASSEPSGLRF